MNLYIIFILIFRKTDQFTPMPYVLQKSYCKKQPNSNITSLSKMVSSEATRADAIFLCSTEIHCADVGIACRILMIYFGHF